MGQVLYITRDGKFSPDPRKAWPFPNAPAATRYIDQNNLAECKIGQHRVQNLDLRKRRKRGRIR